MKKHEITVKIKRDGKTPKWMRKPLKDQKVYRILKVLLSFLVDPGVQFLYATFRDLEKENDNLKCCGNCKKNGTVDMGLIREENCMLGQQIDSSCQVCKKWEPDGLQQEDRRI